MLPSPKELEGKKVPDVVFRLRENDEWKQVKTDEVFAGKTVVVFGLPGAFTPTCSSTHLPRYNELADTFKASGVDDIVCISVNDAFVMNEWRRNQDAGKITCLPDGNGDFTRGIGMLVDKSDLGFGMRSWRYSMLVRDGKIEKAYIEPDKPGDPFEVSDADTMLKHINPEGAAQRSAVIFAKPGCQYCERAKELLRAHNYRMVEITADARITTDAVRAVAGKDSWPQVFIDGRLIGGEKELKQYFDADKPMTAMSS